MEFSYLFFLQGYKGVIEQFDVVAVCSEGNNLFTKSLKFFFQLVIHSVKFEKKMNKVSFLSILPH